MVAEPVYWVEKQSSPKRAAMLPESMAGYLPAMTTPLHGGADPHAWVGLYFSPDSVDAISAKYSNWDTGTAFVAIPHKGEVHEICCQRPNGISASLLRTSNEGEPFLQPPSRFRSPGPA
jgi:hypothetical protein